eukprot:scaffold2808_cov255-Pinguiococcus_pyrenoidosus.AAC.47
MISVSSAENNREDAVRAPRLHPERSLFSARTTRSILSAPKKHLGARKPGQTTQASTRSAR